MITCRSTAAVIAAFSCGLFISLCVWRYAAATASTRAMRLAAAVLAVAGSLNTYTWIIAHHAAVR